MTTASHTQVTARRLPGMAADAAIEINSVFWWGNRDFKIQSDCRRAAGRASAWTGNPTEPNLVNPQ